MYEKQLAESWNSWHSGMDHIPSMNPSLERVFTAGLNAVQDDVVEWHRETFPRATKEAIENKLNEELGELVYALRYCKDEHIKEEMADVAIVMCSLCDKLGVKLHNIVGAKLEVNRGRE